jgi:DNA-binding NtrC family response regulator
MSRILIVEDEAVIRTEIRRLLARQGYEVAEAGSVREATEGHELARFDLILADVRLPGASGMDLVDRGGNVPVLMMTSYATVRSAVDAMKRGAVDYIAKPFDHDELLAVVASILARPRAAPAAPLSAAGRAAPAPPALAGILGDSPPMRDLGRRVQKVAPSDATALVLGESGTGKELVARALHQGSRRRDQPFVPVNCAAIPENLIESELFGHERGAFTGAHAAHAGLVEAADGGTLFLDEIGELPASAQARLLRFLQTGEVRHVGATRARRVSVRVVAATHRDLPALAEAGAFRSDLYFRLRVIELRLPPLRERGHDALLLAQHFLVAAAGRAGVPVPALSAEAEQEILGHPWPGNVRELENAIERAVVLGEDGVVTPELLGLGVEGPASLGEAETLSLQEYFRRFVLEHQGDMTETEIAKRLGISRKALWERRQRFSLPRPRG